MVTLISVIGRSSSMSIEEDTVFLDLMITGTSSETKSLQSSATVEKV